MLEDLWRDAALPAGALERITLRGGEPAVPSSFALGSALQAALGAAALAATVVGALRGGPAQRVDLDLLDAVRESAGRFRLDGRAPDLWDKISGLYRCADDDAGAASWVRIHANFAHHRDGVLELLGLPVGPATERSAVLAALVPWQAEAFESAAAARGWVVAAVRSPQQWQQHPQAAAVAAAPLLQVDRDGDAVPLPWPPAGHDARPLAGLRVLDLTRILAGPVAGRTLAAWGAEVMLVNAPHLPNIEAIADTSRGKLSVLLDLRTRVDRDTLRALVRGCDVFLQGYRPGALQALGFGPDELQRLRPGIVSLSLSAYGTSGPWAARRGFDSLVQSATGINVDEAAAFGSGTPRALPLPALDYGAGYLLSFGALVALLRQRQLGGSWRVQVSLAGVGHWLQGLGRVAGGPAAAVPSFDGAFEETDTGFGRLRAVRHAVRLSHANCGWRRPAMPPGSHAPVWPDPGAAA